jgi:hypothetical protein
MNRIFCRRRGEMHEFYISADGTEYYLFTQAFRRSVDEYYRQGVIIDKAISHGIGRKDRAIHKTMDKLKLYIRYIEAQEEIVLLRKTGKKMRTAA